MAWLEIRDDSEPPLPQAVGYVIVVVVGLIITFGISLHSHFSGLQS